jgi:RNA polymerase-binding transcription factor DksA
MHIEELALSDRLIEVEHALAKFQTGTYGLCEKCGAPIPTGRLRALPEARFDIEHESAFERSIHAEEQLPERF